MSIDITKARRRAVARIIMALKDLATSERKEEIDDTEVLASLASTLLTAWVAPALTPERNDVLFLKLLLFLTQGVEAARLGLKVDFDLNRVGEEDSNVHQ